MDGADGLLLERAPLTGAALVVAALVIAAFWLVPIASILAVYLATLLSPKLRRWVLGHLF